MEEASERHDEKRKKKKRCERRGCYAGDEGAATHLANGTPGEQHTWGATHLLYLACV